MQSAPPAASQGLGISFQQYQQQQQQQQQPFITSPVRTRTPMNQPAFSLRPTHSRASPSIASPSRSVREQDQEDDDQTPLVSHRPLPASSEAGSSRKGSLLPRAGSRASSFISNASGSTRKLAKRPSQSDISNRDGRAPSPTPGQPQGTFSRLSDHDDTARPLSYHQSTENSIYTEEIEATPKPESSAGHSISPIDFPAPPADRPIYQSQVSPEGFPPPMSTSPEEYLGPRVISQHIPRSASVPLGMPPTVQSPPKPRLQEQKRTSANSALSAGTHSRNAALLQAERGGMLSYSPGHGVYRHGEAIGTPIGTPIEANNNFIPRSAPPPPGPRQAPQPSIVHFPIPAGRQRSNSDGAALLLRQGTLLHPQSSNKRASTELGILLGSKSSRRLSTGKLLPAPEEEVMRRMELMMRDDGHGGMVGKDQRVGLEAKKKAKARIEVDVVLERDCVVEGGEVRGRLEVLVRGGKRGEGVRVGAGKIRVLGFEDLAPPAQRHIFYHQSYPLPLFSNPPVLNGPTSSLFGSEPDEEGYRLAVEGSHFIPFSMRLPLGGGAKGTYTAPGGKGPCVRYVAVGSVKLHMTATNKRSIAHFYRPIHLLPYLNPSTTLAPAPYPIVANVQRGLGWSLGGEKGRVDLTARIARANWVSGQRIWCEVGVRNGSSKKIKTLSIALLQTAQVFMPTPDPGQGCLPLSARVSKSEGREANTGSSARRKISEEILEADGTSKGAGRVTGKGWWTGVDAGGQGRWECSLLVPAGLVSIRRSKLIEVSYVLRVTINGSIYVDLPVTLINFLSIDPPPPFLSPGSIPLAVPGTVQMPIAMAKHKSQQNVVDINDTFKRGFEVSVDYGAYDQVPAQQNLLARSTSDFSLNMQSGPARASSTTLDLDQLLAAGQARADEARRSGADQFKSRPVSMSESLASNYGGARSAEGPTTSYSNHQTMEPIKRSRSTPLLRNKSSHDQPYASDAESGLSGDEEERDLHAAEARRRMGRQLSLAVIGHDGESQKASPVPEVVEEDDAGSEELTPRDDGSAPAFLPASTPHGESIKMMQDTPFVPDVPQLSPTPIPDEICEEEEPTSEDERHEHESVLDDIMTDEYEHVLDVDFGNVADQTFGSEFDYADEIAASPVQSPHSPSVRADKLDDFVGNGSYDAVVAPGVVTDLLSSRTRDEHVAQSRSVFGSFAASAVSGQSGGEESELGMVQQAVRRNVSIKVPPQLEPAIGRRESSASSTRSKAMESPASSPRKLSIVTGMSRQASQDSNRKLSMSSPIGMRRELSNGPSPLREGALRSAAPPSPSPSRVLRKYSDGGGSPSSRSRLAYSPGPSPMSKSTSAMRRTESTQSQRLDEREETEVPELAQSVAGDSASSEGDGLESPQMDILTPLVSPQTGNVRSPGRRALPRVPSVRSVGSPQSASTSSNRASWSPSAALIRSQSIFGNAAKVPLAYPPPRGPRDRPASIISQDHNPPLSPTESTTSSVNSVLPSVRSKIAQMENRDQALRQFTNVALAQTTAGPPQRRSYTAALGRMSQHSAYEEDDAHHASEYTNRRQSSTTYRNRQNPYDNEVASNHMRKDSVASNDSNSTTATTIEDALLSRHTSLASRKTHNALSPRQMLPTVYMNAGSDEESSDGLL